MFAGAFGIYQDETEDQLWAVWKEAGGTEHHARVARAKRTVIWLGAAQGDVNSASLTYIGANGDVGTLRFVDAATNNAVWNFGRPDDWDYGEIRITVYWSNVGASVSGNHYCPQRLVGWAVGEDVSTPSGNQIWGGAKTITGVSDAGKIEQLVIDDGSAQDLTGEDFFTYRFQRQGANGLDTSSQTLDVFGIKVELISV
jgi:hypothetical protein